MTRTTFILFATYVAAGTAIWGLFDQSFLAFAIVCAGGIPLAIVRAYMDQRK